MQSCSHIERIQGCLIGMALGDAYGAPTEFMSIAEIHAKWPPSGPHEPLGYPISHTRSQLEQGLIQSFRARGQLEDIAPNLLYVTDDTQMALAVGYALQDVFRLQSPLKPTEFVQALTERFVHWLLDPENNRAPGNTCLSACEGLQRGLPWLKATVRGSKGCGANMRVQSVGLLQVGTHIQSEHDRAGAAQLQAAITHSHPTALTASDITAYTLSLLLKGYSSDTILDALFAYVETQRRVYHSKWLSTLWERPGIQTAEEFIERGWDEVEAVLHRVRSGLSQSTEVPDPCTLTGAGWIAEEAFATALYCFLRYPDEPLRILQVASVTSGDSDSIACLAGSFAGVYHGIYAWPQHWVERIEYKQQLYSLSEALDIG